MNQKRIKRAGLLLSILLAAALILTAGLLPVGAEAAPARHADGLNDNGAPLSVYLGGMPFGVKFYTEGVLVVGFCDVADGTDGTSGNGASGGKARNPAREAGIRLRDVITAVNGTHLGSAAELTAAVENSGGRPLSLTIRRAAPARSRDGTGCAQTGTQTQYEISTQKQNESQTEIRTETVTVKVTPVFSRAENRWKTGIWVRDSGAGIGMVTFILPRTRAFAGLGHGICDGDTGELIPMQRGLVTDVTVSGIRRGTAGEPGAIKGYFDPGKTGTLVGNTACGVFGILSELPAGADCLIPAAPRTQVRDGPAVIRCTLDDGRVGEYSVAVSCVDTSATGSRCFTVTVTDPALLQRTGGIVQGMSGSPIIQNGRLIGAVTHVLINDPAVGYGIFIDNMLREMPELLR